MRLAVGLTIIGAASLICGLMMIFVGEALRLKSAHSGHGAVRAGEFAAICGLASGVALLVVLAVGQAERAGRVRRVSLGAAAASRVAVAAEQWLDPMRSGAGLAPQRGLRVRPGPAEGVRPGSGYADDGWYPSPGDGWDPGPAYVWSPPERDHWARDRHRGQGAAGWPDHDGQQGPGDGRHPDPTAQPGGRPFPPAGPRPPDERRQRSEPAGGRQARYLTGPDPRYVGPQPGGYLAGPEPEEVPGPSADYLADQQARPARASGPSESAHSDAPGSRFSASDEPAADDTSPLPAILGPNLPAREPGAPAAGPGLSEYPRPPEPFSVWEPAAKPGPERASHPGGSHSDRVYQPAHAELPPADTQEKIEQIKDLYLTAEAIGEDALSKHFDQLRQRQRSLISEFFEKAGLGSSTLPKPDIGDSPQNGASLSG